MIDQKLPPFINVAASGPATLEMPIGMTYNRIILNLGGTTFTKAMITSIKLKLNGKVFYEVTGTHLDIINKYKAVPATADANFLTIDFDEIECKDLGGMYAGAIGTAEGVLARGGFTAEVTIGGATAPTLQGYAQLTEPRKLDVINALVKHSVSFAASGKFPVQLPYGQNAGHLLQRAFFFHTNMTSLEVKKNGLVIFEDLPVAINEFIQKEFKKVPQSGLYVYDPIINNDPNRVVSTENALNMQYNVTVSAADTITIYAEYITKLENL